MCPAGSRKRIAVVAGQTLLSFINVATVRRVTAVGLFGLAVYTFCLALG